MPYSFSKKEHHHHHLKKKKFKTSKNHASISKLGACGHASSILKKKKSSFPQISRFSKKSCINMQTRGIRPCLICLKKKKKDHHHHHHLKKKKNQDFQKHTLKGKLGAFDYASFRWDHPSEDLPSKFKVLSNKVASGKL